MFLENPAEWWFKYVRYPEKPQERVWAFELGGAYHNGLETMYKTGKLNDALDMFHEVEPRNEYEVMDVGTMEQAIKYYYDKVYPLYAKSVDYEAVEQHVTDFYIDGIDIPIHLRLDLYTRDGIIIDHKTVGYKDVKAAKSGQGMLYSLWYWKTKGRLPIGFEYHKAWKKPKAEPITIDRTGFTRLDMLNIEQLFRSVYKMMKGGIIYWRVGARECGFEDEWAMMLDKGLNNFNFI